MAEVRPVVITGLVEGRLDEAVLGCLVREAGARLGEVHGTKGKAHLLGHLRGYNESARFIPWVALVDLDRDAECAPAIRESWLPEPAESMCFCIVVRAIEAWLLADRERMAAFLDVPVSRIPLRPEGEADPKRKLVEIARRSRSKTIKEMLVTGPKSRELVGRSYSLKLARFAEDHWRPEVAARNADSLRRCRERLEALVQGRMV
jgi:hypothetical protein